MWRKKRRFEVRFPSAAGDDRSHSGMRGALFENYITFLLAVCYDSLSLLKGDKSDKS